MKAKWLLRIAGAAAVVEAVLHTIGGVFGKPEPGAASAAVAAMQANRFALAGADRSYWDFYIGFGLAITVSLAMEGIVLWMLGSLAEKGVDVRPVLAVFFAGYVLLAVVAYRYIFAPPVICDALIAALVGLAIYAAKPVSAPAAVGVEA